MSETNAFSFQNGVSNLLNSFIFPAISTGLATKGISVSTEELSSMTNTPVVRQTTQYVPPSSFGGAVPSMTPAIPPSARKPAATTTTDNPISGKTCMYQFKRGDKKGEYCGKPTLEGNQYCKACIKSRKLPTAGGSQPYTAVPGAAPAYGVMGGVPPPPEDNSIDAICIDEAKKLYRINNTNIMITSDDESGNIFVIGTYDSQENKVIPVLSDTEVTFVKSKGLDISSNVVQGSNSPVSSASSSPTSPTFSQAPVAPAIPTYNAAPVVPAVPTYNASVPSVPTYNAPPSVPAVPTFNVPPGIPPIPSFTNPPQ